MCWPDLINLFLWRAVGPQLTSPGPVLTEHFGLWVFETGAFEGRSNCNQSVGAVVAVAHISGSWSLTAEHFVAPRMVSSGHLVLGLWRKDRVFQRRCGASFCRGSLATRRNV